MLEKFLREQKILTKFKKTYKTAGFTSNPESVEEYLEEQSNHPLAIINAFGWIGSKNLDCWINTSRAWNKYLEDSNIK